MRRRARSKSYQEATSTDQADLLYIATLTTQRNGQRRRDGRWQVLLPAFETGSAQGQKIKHFLVDATLPTPLFEALHRREQQGRGAKKGGKKKGKGKKK